MSGNRRAVVCVAGGLFPVAAAAQHAGELTLARHAGSPTAVRYAGVRMTPQGLFRTTEWRPYVGGSGTDIPEVKAFDCFKVDSFNQPTGFCDSGCNQLGNCPGAPPDSRWTFGPTALRPQWVNDMTVAPGQAGALSRRAMFAWTWGSPVAAPCWVALVTHETFNPCGGATPTDGPYDGVVVEFLPFAGGGGYQTFDADVSADPDPTLGWQLPMDGQGAYSYFIASAEDPVTGQLTLDMTPGTANAFWGTGEDETPPDGRAGEQNAFGYDDANPADGVFDTTAECFDFTAGAGQCPVELGAMVLFYTEGGGACYANCDNSTQTPVLNVADFTCFLQRFAAGESYANCDQSTLAPVLNVADFTCFLQSFAAGCP